MPATTLLQMVQRVLNDMDGDEVNSISDSVFAQQVAEIIRATYFALIHDKDWPHLWKTFRLDNYAPDPNTYPILMKLPDNVQEMSWLRYNKMKATDTRNKYLDVDYLKPEDFINVVNAYNTDNTDVDTLTLPVAGDITIAYLNDEAPSYWTTFDDEYIVFNSFDSAVESNLQNSKTQCYGYVEPTWTSSDTYVIDLPHDSIPLLEYEAKSMAFATIGQEANAKVEQTAKRQRRRKSRTNWRAAGGFNFPDFGRRRQAFTHTAKD